MIWYLLFFFSLFFGQILRIEAFGAAITGLDVGVFLLFISSLFILKKHRNLLIKNRIAQPLALFLLSAAVSLLITSLSLPLSQTVISFLYLVRLTIYVGLFFVTRSYLAERKITKDFLVFGLLASGLGIALAGFLQLVFYPDIRNLYYLGWDPHFGRLVSTTFDPNFTGIILVTTLFLALNQFINSQDKNHKLLFLFFLSLIFAAIAFTYSRSTYFALLIGISAWAILRKEVKYFLIVAVLLTSTIYFIPKPQGEGGKLTRTSTTSARIINWQESITLWQKSPFFGFGYNSLSFVKEKYGLLPKSQENIPNHALAGVDNSLLFVLLTTGIPGLLFFLWFLWEVYKKVASGKKVYLPIFFAVLFHSVFQNTLFFPQVLASLMLLLAITDYGNSLKKVENI